MIIEIFLFLIVLLEATRAYLQYKALPDKTKEEIKDRISVKPESQVVTWKPEPTEREKTVASVLKKIFK